MGLGLGGSGGAGDDAPRVFNVAYGTTSTFSEDYERVTFAGAAAGTTRWAIATQPRSTGKFQMSFEAVVNTAELRTVALMPYDPLVAAGLSIADGSNTAYAYARDGDKYNLGIYSSYGSTWTTLGDIISVLADLDAGEISFGLNGVNQGVAYSGLSGWFVSACYANGSTDVSFRIVQAPTLFPGYSKW